MSTLEERMAERTKKCWEIQKLNTLLGPMPATVWSTKPDSRTGRLEGPMVLIRSRSERPDITVLSVVEVVRADTTLVLDDSMPEPVVDPGLLAFFTGALDEDLILERQLTDLPFRCMVRTSNLFPTTPDYLLRCIGELDETLMYIINRMATACITRISMEQAIGCGSGTLSVEPLTLTPLLNYANLVRTGLPCTSEADPRLARLRLAYQERSYLSREAKRNFPW